MVDAIDQGSWSPLWLSLVPSQYVFHTASSLSKELFHSPEVAQQVSQLGHSGRHYNDYFDPLPVEYIGQVV